MSLEYDVDIIRNNTRNQVSITGSGGGSWTSFLRDDFQLQTQAEFSTPFDDSLSGMNDGLSQLIAAVNISGLVGEVKPIQLKVPATTVNVWRNSGRPQIQLNLLFLKASASDPSPVATIAGLACLCQPQGGKTLTDFYSAPAGYSATKGGAVGTFNVSIGHWFRAMQLNLLSVGVSVTKSTDKNGDPIVAEATVTLEPYVLPNEDTVRGWFK